MLFSVVFSYIYKRSLNHLIKLKKLKSKINKFILIYLYNEQE